MKLYDVGMSSNCKKVRICAAELGLPLEIVPLNPNAGENRRPDYLAKNPMGKVPTLEDGDFVLFESGAIMAYLARKKPEAGLFPTDPRGEAEVLRWMLFNHSHLQPFSSTLAVEKVFKPMRGGKTDEALVAHAEGELKRFLPVVEEQLKTHEFLTGRFSIADIATGCGFESFAKTGVSLEPYPHIAQWLARIQARPAWKAATK